MRSSIAMELSVFGSAGEGNNRLAMIKGYKCTMSS